VSCTHEQDGIKVGSVAPSQFGTVAFSSENRYVFPKFPHHFIPMKTINQSHRKSIRLKEYDYSLPGEYFVTICTHNHSCTLGKIINGEMRLNEIGKIVEKEWLRTPNVRPGIELDVYVVMPNHIHGIIVITDESPIAQVGTHSCASLQRKPRSLGSIIAGFKSAATKRINEVRNTPSVPMWQKRYYDRIIRNDKELNKIRDYIYNNVLLWGIRRDDPDNIPLW
jgi:putative transposase